MRFFIMLAAGTALYLCPAPAAAQDQAAAPQPDAPPARAADAASGVLVYPPEFFASSSPNTALDMIRRLPGFALDVGNSGTRGLSGAGGNVLIDGDRPSSKSDNLFEILGRIAAGGVERIELIRGGAPGIDMQGRPVIANVVLKRAATTESVIEANAYLYPDGAYVGPQLKGQYSRREGDNQTEAAFFTTTDRTGGTAWGSRRRTDASGNTIQTAGLSLRDRYQTVNARGSLQRRFGGGKLRLNALAEYTSLENSQLIDILSGPGSDDSNRDVSKAPSGEFGANWIRALGPRSEIELTALQRLDHTAYRADSSGGGQPSTFTIASTGGESVGRGIFRFRPNARWAFEAGGEVAYNFLDSATGFTVSGTPIALPNAAVFVSELRGEAFGQGTWHPSSKLTVEAGLRVELSTISQTGDVDLSRSFTYPKPRVQLTWIPAKGHQLRFGIEQAVGQLDFGDFSASTEVNLGTINGGNARLEPQKDLIFEAVYERRFWNKGVVELALKHREVTDVIDIVPLVGGFDAVGNIGNGTYNSLKGSLTLPLDKLGIKNALLSGRFIVARSSVVDPLTGEKRRFSGEIPFGCGISFSHDLKGGRFSYGAEHGCNVDRYNTYRVREVRLVDQDPFVSVYAQWKPRPKLTVRVDLGNVTDFRLRTVRDVYTGPRNVAPLAFSEERLLRRGRYLFVQLRQVL